MSEPETLDLYRAGSTEPWTANLLAALVVAKKPQILVETGTFEARTTFKLFGAMAEYASLHGSFLFTVESDFPRFDAAHRLIASWPALNNVGVQAVHGDAEAFLGSPALQKGVDFVFLDDDHDAAHVHREIALCAKLLRPGGIIAVHDVIGHFGLGEVVQSYGGIILDFPRLHVSGGLGLIVKQA